VNFDHRASSGSENQQGARHQRAKFIALLCGVLFAWAGPAEASGAAVSGRVLDPQGRAVPRAKIKLVPQPGAASLRDVNGESDQTGSFMIRLPQPGSYRIHAEAPGFTPVDQPVTLSAGQTVTSDLQFREIATDKQAVTVVADLTDVDVFVPDPAQRVLVRHEMLDANPGRPGAPVSIPGMPTESPAGGIKPPQYFVPGVAGDHGEPIAQYIQVGGLLLPNNFPANAHGNGYADPNILIPAAIGSVQTDGGAFNVRQGNNAINMAATFGLREQFQPFVRLTGDSRNANLVIGWSPVNPGTRGWIVAETSYGNGYLRTLEHRKQYKLNAFRAARFGRHELSVFGLGYYGFSFLPGLSPIEVRLLDDTVDPRQLEKANSGIFAINDTWRIDDNRQMQFSGYFRTYGLDVRSNFGEGFIRQTEFRTVGGGSTLYAHKFNRTLSGLTGIEYRREAPRDLNLRRETDIGLMPLVTSNDLTIKFASPFAAVEGALTPYLRYNLGFRRDEVNLDNRDKLRPDASFQVQQGVSLPKGTLTLLPPESTYLPSVALSYGQAFHVNDPRIGTTAERGTIISKATAYQLVLSKTALNTAFRATAVRVTRDQQLAKISADTGLQEDVGPALIRSIVLSARRYFAFGSLQGSFARADARDRITGEPVPEAPRLIWDVLGTIDRLPFGLQTRGQFSYVGRKPLGEGLVAVPVRQYRGAVVRSFERQRMDVGVNFLVASGFAGQTLEALQLAGEPEPVQRIVGYRLKSYVTLSWTYHFRRRR